MRRTLRLTFALAALALAPEGAAQTGGGFDLTWSDIASGGGTTGFGGGIYALTGAYGQPDAGQSAGGGFELRGGFLGGPCAGAAVEHGTGCAGTGGFVPHLSVIGCPSSTKTIHLAISEALGGSQAFLFLGLGQTVVPMGGGCNFNIAPHLPPIIGPLPMLGSGAGAGGLALPVTIPPGIAGFTVNLQVMVVDPASSIGVTTSNGVAMTIG